MISGKLVSFIFLAQLAFPSPAWSAIERPPLVLVRGEQRLLRLPGLFKYSIGSSNIRAKSLGKEGDSTLLVKGIQAGVGDLWVWKRDTEPEHRTVRVENVAPEELKPALERALGSLQEVEVLYSGGGVVLTGEIRSLQESARIAALVSRHPQEITDETVLSAELLSTGRAVLEAWLKQSGHAGDLRVEIFSQTLWVRGNIEKVSEKAILEKRIRTLFPPAQLEIESLPDSAPTVYFRVFLLELKKNRFSTLGLSWPAFQEGAFRVTTSSIQDFLALDVTLHELEGDGSARLLSNPELVVRAPGEAELFAGGELPIQQKGHFFSNLTWKNYGLSLQLKVTNTTGDRVRLDISTEVSHLDPSIAIDQIPGIQANRMKTQVDARYGVPLLLSGLLQQGTREQAKGLPLLRSIPVLGLLFGSQDYLNERSELVAILYPHTAPPPAPMDKFGIHPDRHPRPPWGRPQEEAPPIEIPSTEPLLETRADTAFPWNHIE